MSYPAITPLLTGYQESVQDTIIRTTMDQGPAKVRQRTTAAVRPIIVTYLLTAAQVTTLESFYVTEVAGGALAFSFTHPRTNAAVTARFTKPLSYVPNGSLFTVTVALEIMP